MEKKNTVESFAKEAAELLKEARDKWCCAGIVQNDKLNNLLLQAEALNLLTKK